eukprot:TRINITY_DN469_c4_g1_i2.p1 TRINITY_DN469_c4_g1~~TRINITY_DN469_c4_g1_i2.p1  ORF type:complete len:667 (-),score=223.43 TRINITY_DN469_c4_g1_i2:80-2080(-)
MASMKSLVLMAGMSQAIVLRQDANEDADVNPVRKVIGLLQKMTKKIETQGSTEGKTYDKYECYCKTTLERLASEIKAATGPNAISQDDIDSAKGELERSQSETEQFKVDKVSATASLEKAIAEREKAAEEHEAASARESDTVTAAGEAINILTGKNLGLLQAFKSPSAVTAALQKEGVSDKIQQKVTSLLSEIQSPDMAVGTLSEIKKVADANHKKLVETEETSIAEFKELRDTKNKEIIAIDQKLENRQARSAELRVKIVDMKDDLKNTLETLASNQKYEKELKASCDEKASQWTERSKIRNEELATIAETIEMLNADEAQDVFRKALKTAKAAALIEIPSAKEKALIAIKQASSTTKNPQLNMLSLMLESKAVDFTKVTKMIDDMLVLLKEEESGDLKKKDYCNKEFADNSAAQKKLKRDLEDVTADVEEKDAKLEILTTDLEQINAVLKEFDDLVKKAADTRNAEKKELKELVASNTAAIELVNVAKNRMNKFYNPHLYKATTAKSPYALSFIETEKVVDLKAPDVGFKGSYSKAAGGTSIIGMMTTIVGDLSQEIKTGKQDDIIAQKRFEGLMADSARKTASERALVTEKSQMKADLEEEKLKASTEKDAKSSQMDAMKKMETNLKGECDWLLKNFEERKDARINEMLSLKDAKSTLAGAKV